MVENLPHHPKVEGSQPNIFRPLSLFIYLANAVVEHKPHHPKVKGSSLTTPADIAREMAKNVLSFILMVIIYLANNHNGRAQA